MKKIIIICALSISFFILTEGQRLIFSKSENRGIFAEDAVKEFDADYILGDICTCDSFTTSEPFVNELNNNYFNQNENENCR